MADLTCPKCGKPPLLYWLHTLPVPQGRMKALRLLTKHHQEAKPCYGCHDCNLYTGPYETEEQAAEAWKEGIVL